MSLFVFGTPSTSLTLWKYLEDGSFEFVKQIPSESPQGTDSPTWIVSSKCGRYIFCTNENDRSVSSYECIKSNGELQDLQLLTTVRSGGGGPCHANCSADMKNLFVANYGTGTLAVMPLRRDGSALPLVQDIDHNPEGETDKAHAHCIMKGHRDDIFYCCDLGMDTVYTYQLTEGVEISLLKQIGALQLPTGTGPRHITVHPSGRFAFIVNEVSNTVCVVEIDPRTHCLSSDFEGFEFLTTLQDGVVGTPETFGAAEILLSQNQKFLYISNRCIETGLDEESMKNLTTVAIFEVLDEGRRLQKINNFCTQGIHPRHMCLTDEDTRLIVANKVSNNVVSFHVDVNTGLVDESSAVITSTTDNCPNISFVMRV